MQRGQPSRTALGAAGLRAAHQVLDRAAIFTDPLALRILGPDADAMVQEAATDRSRARRIVKRVKAKLRGAAELRSSGRRRGQVLFRRRGDGRRVQIC